MGSLFLNAIFSKHFKIPTTTFLRGLSHIVGYNSIQAYIATKQMDQDSAWGTDIEMLTLAHLLNTPILSYSVQHGSWQRYSPHHVDRSLVDDFHKMSMYIIHDHNHFNVVCSIRKTT